MVKAEQSRSAAEVGKDLKHHWGFVQIDLVLLQANHGLPDERIEEIRGHIKRCIHLAAEWGLTTGKAEMFAAVAEPIVQDMERMAGLREGGGNAQG